MKIALYISLGIALLLSFSHITVENSSKKVSIKKLPHDWAFQQRAYPYTEINEQTRSKIRAQAIKMRAKQAQEKGAGFQWSLAGPTNISGRITAIAVDQVNNIIYTGAASGGIFKVTNNGVNVVPIFDDQAALSIGALALDPTNPSILYAGTGEANAASNTGAFPGNGIYKSIDAGVTWNHMGLDQSFYIGRIVVNPKNTNQIYAACTGKYWGKNPERGIYRSNDGGVTWSNVLYINDSTACIDIAINPINPDTVYAAMWTRIRHPSYRNAGGEESAVYRSVDGGNNWIKLAGGLPISDNETGRIGIAVSANSPNILFAAYSYDAQLNNFDALYKSTDHGNTWAQVDQSGLGNAYASFGWYFGNVRVDPSDPNKVYVVGFDLYNSTNGGVNFNSNTNFQVHSDIHDLWIDPSNSSHMICAGDGGLFETTTAGSSWDHYDNFPITQFYACHIDYQTPSRLYGGTQDNNTIRTMTGALDDWQAILGGDGFYSLVDPSDDNYVYAESQWGGLRRSTNGGSSMGYAKNGISGNDRFNWNAPLAMDPQTPSTLYFGSQRIYKTTDRAQNWVAISNDLTNGASTSHATLTTISVSPLNSNIIYAGTQDGNVWNTLDGGATWNDISANLPDLWCTRVAPSPFNANTAFVTFSGYPWDDYLPHVFKTTDNGATWSDISSNLPSFPINDIIVDPDYDGYLYAASDYGVLVSWDSGGSWSILGTNHPNVPVFDLEFHQPTRKLLSGTHGRSLHMVDLTNVFPVSSSLKVESENHIQIFPIPSKDQINIRFDENVTNYMANVYSIEGKLIFSEKLAGKQNSISLKNILPKGNYILRLIGDGFIESKNIIIQ